MNQTLRLAFGGTEYFSSYTIHLVILAFLVPAVLEWMDDQYQRLRRKLTSRQRWFGDIRTLTRYLCFENWGMP